jgi:zinc transport system ATP-binding protein
VLSADDLTVELGGLPVLRGVSVSVRVGGRGPDGRQRLREVHPGPYAPGPSPTNAVLYALRLTWGFRQWSRIGYVPQRSAAMLGGSKVKEVVAAGRLARRRFRPLRRQDQGHT